MKRTPEGLEPLAEALRRLAESDDPEAIEQAARAYSEATWRAFEQREARARGIDVAEQRQVRSLGQIIGTNLRVWRERAGLTQAQASEALTRAGLPCSRAMVSESESAKRTVSLDELVFWAAAFGVPVFALVELPRNIDIALSETRIVPAEVVSEVLTGVPPIDTAPADHFMGPHWAAAAYVARSVPGPNDFRPAARLVEAWRSAANTVAMSVGKARAVLESARRRVAEAERSGEGTGDAVVERGAAQQAFDDAVRRSEAIGKPPAKGADDG
jgi:transcriptional regulator with XRE-family HTH domain